MRALSVANLKHIIFAIVAGLIAVPALPQQAARAQKLQSPVFTVAKVAVRAEAADAVEAKQKAIRQGQREALTRIMKRVTGFSSYARLPRLDDAAIERMVEGLRVRSERNSGTVYLANLDFSFDAAAVKTVLNRFGLAYVTDRAPEIVLLPVYIEAGAIKQAASNPWHAAIAEFDLQNGLTPVKLVAPRPDIGPDFARRIAADPSRGMETLSYQYRAEFLVLAIAEVDPGMTMMRVTLAGRDAVGPIALERSFKIYGRDVSEAAEQAAAMVLSMLEGRWKLTRLASQGALDGPQELVRLELSAQFSGLKEWQSIRERLQRVPGVQGLEVKVVNPRSAIISIDFPGGGERLSAAASGHGLRVEGAGGSWLVRVQ